MSANFLKSEFFRTTFMPVVLLLTSPLIVLALWEINILFEGSVLLWAAELPHSLFSNIPYVRRPWHRSSFFLSLIFFVPFFFFSRR